MDKSWVQSQTCHRAAINKMRQNYLCPHGKLSAMKMQVVGRNAHMTPFVFNWKNRHLPWLPCAQHWFKHFVCINSLRSHNDPAQ